MASNGEHAPDQDEVHINVDSPKNATSGSLKNVLSLDHVFDENYVDETTPLASGQAATTNQDLEDFELPDYIIHQKGGTFSGVPFDTNVTEEEIREMNEKTRGAGLVPQFDFATIAQKSMTYSGRFELSTALAKNVEKSKQDAENAEKEKKKNIKSKKKKNVVPKNEMTKLVASKEIFHKLTESELERELKTSLTDGLTETSAKEKLVLFGANVLTSPKTTPWYVRLFKALTGGFQLLLWVGFFLCVIVDGLVNWQDPQTLSLGIVCAIIVLLTGCFQTWQEGKSDSVMKALRALGAQVSSVIRDGKSVVVDASALVPGDIVQVKAGDKVPADLRILKSLGLKVNKAPLTGENVDIALFPEPNAETQYEAKNIAQSGCSFTMGSGIGVVFATGDNTFFGGIAAATLNTKRPETLMKQEIHRLVLALAALAICIGFTFAVLAKVRGYTWVETIVFFIGIVVANVPEGLLPQITVALTLTAQRMLKINVLVSNLEIIETLGATTVICSDKTGTLTENRMTVSHIFYDGKIHITPLSPVMPGDEFSEFKVAHPTFQALQRSCTLNTDADFLDDKPDVYTRSTKGDASETALIKFVEPLRPIASWRAAAKRLTGIPFNSTNKWMVTIVSDENNPTNNPAQLMMKGAPEKVLAMCTTVMIDGKIEALTPQRSQEIEAANVNLAVRGERVLAFAGLDLPKDKFPEGFEYDADIVPPNFPTTGLTYYGQISLIDPPREGVKHAISLCNKAGVQVFMVTGDHPITACSIAKSIGLVTSPTVDDLVAQGKTLEHAKKEAKAIVLHGEMLLTYTEEDWQGLNSYKEIVFARTMPTQKQDIVKWLRGLGHVVSMTGDGVNDAPALKAANCGIAMGSGSSVAKEAAQVVLRDDNFSSIVQGIAEGRLIFDNLKKTIMYVLSSNVPELVPFLIFVISDVPLALETIMVLYIDVGTDLAPAVSLAYEEGDDSLMDRPPRKNTDHIVSWRLLIVSYLVVGVIETMGCYFAYAIVFHDAGFGINEVYGSGVEWRTKPGAYANPDRARRFMEICQTIINPAVWKEEGEGYTGGCSMDMMDQMSFWLWRYALLSKAQSAFLMTCIWAQLGNGLARKTLLASSLATGCKIFTSNMQLTYSMVSEVFIILFITYVPGLNTALFMHELSFKQAISGLWVMPFILLFEEGRKWIMRRWPQGIVARLTAL